jgi:hypothetical protein
MGVSDTIKTTSGWFFRRSKKPFNGYRTAGLVILADENPVGF